MNNRLAELVRLRLANRINIIRNAWVSIICLAILAGWFIYTEHIVERGPFYWDESVHAMQGVLFAHSLQEGNWLAFLFDSYRQVLYPPLYAWGLGLSFLLMGYSVQAACLVSLVGFILTALVLYVAQNYLSENNQAVAGSVSSILFLGSPILISFATQTMSEITGLFFFTITIFIYLKILRYHSSPYAYAWLGLTVALTYFARIQYGVLIFVAVTGTIILEAWFEQAAIIRSRLLYFLLPLLFIFGLWFAYPAKLFATWGWLVNTSNVSDPYSLSGWLFYPQATVRLAGSLWLFMLYLVVIAICVARFGKKRAVRFLLIIVALQLFLGMVHHNRQDRYLLPILPSIFLLTGFIVAKAHHLYRSGSANTPLKLLVTWGLPLFIIFHSMVFFVFTLRKPPIGSARNLNAVTQIAQVVEKTGTTLIIATRAINEPSPPLLDWYLVVQAKVLDAPQAGSVTQIEEERRLSKRLTGLTLPNGLMSQLAPIFRADAPGKTRTVYLGHPGRASYSHSPQAFAAFFQETYSITPSFQGVMVITVRSNCGQYCLEYVTPAIDKVGLQHVETRLIENSNLRLDLYKK